MKLTDDPSQLDIFDPRTMARGSDPDTSKAAAESIIADLPRLEGVVLRVLLKAGDDGLTLDEIIEATGLDKVTASPRLRPLADRGLVEATTMRRFGKSLRMQIVWCAKCPIK